MSKTGTNMWRSCCRLTLMAGALLLSKPALADKSQASEHFDRGVELYQEGNLDAALVELERAYELSPDYRLLYNIAQVQAERHEYVAAIDLFERYLDEGRGELSAERQGKVEGELESLKKRVAVVAVEVNVPGATISLNDVEVGKSPLDEAILVNAGMSRLRIEKEGYVTQTRTLQVAGQDRPKLNFELERETDSTPQMSAADSEPLSQRGPVQDSTPEDPATKANYTPFWVSAGVAVVLGGVAGTFGYMALHNDKSLDDEFNRLPADPDRIDQLSNRVDSYALTSDVATAGAAVAAIVAVYFLVSPPKRRLSDDTGARPGAHVVTIGGVPTLEVRF